MRRREEYDDINSDSFFIFINMGQMESSQGHPVLCD